MSHPFNRSAKPDRVVVPRHVRSLKRYGNNPRTHSRKQIQQLAASISRFGFTNPVLIDEDGIVLAGHARLEAAELLGLEFVPTLRFDHLTDAEKRAYIIADNRLAELAGWDKERLAVELQDLSELELDFSVEITGFETAEIDLLIDGRAASQPDHADILPASDRLEPPVTRQGDLWRLGRHRLLCGSALDPGSYRTLLAGARAQMVFIDPPYNVPLGGHAVGSGAIKHRDFVMASGEMSEAEYVGFLSAALRHLCHNSIDGSIHFICIDWRHVYELMTAGRRVYSELKNLCVWNKDNAGMGSFYRSKHELVLVFKNGTKPHVNNFGLGEHGRYRTNVWDYPGVNTLQETGREELSMHPTTKPVAMVADAIRDCSKRGGLILDAFAGSGTTIVAAVKTGRLACALELDPHYADVAIRRWEAFTGDQARHAETGLTLTETAERRISNVPLLSPPTTDKTEED